MDIPFGRSNTHSLADKTTLVAPERSSNGLINDKTTTKTENTTTSTTPSTSKNTATVGISSSKQTLQVLQQQLTQTPSLTAKVVSSQVVNEPILEKLTTLNPELAKIVQSKLHSSTHSLESNRLYLVKLGNITANTANNSPNAIQPAINNRILTTITNTLFRPGDTLDLQLNQRQQIEIKPSIASVRPAIVEGLKNALSNQSNTSTLLQFANRLVNITQTPSAPLSLQQLLSSASTQALQNLQSLSYKEGQLSTPSQVKQAIANSGLFTEQKINQGQPISHDLRHLLQTLQQTFTAANSDSPSLSKAAIEELLSLLSVQYSSTGGSSLHRTTSEPPLSAQLSSILQLFGMKGAATEKESLHKIKEVLEKQLQQLISGVQKKVYLNQLRSLGNDSTSQEQITQKLVSLNTEVSLRWGDQMLPLQMSIHEHVEKDPSENTPNNNEESSITRRWQVFLSFDLPRVNPTEYDQLHVQLTLIKDSISATLWSESRSLCAQAKQQLVQLRQALMSKGLEVDELQCINGQPPLPTLNLDYNLVDIVT